MMVLDGEKEPGRTHVNEHSCKVLLVKEGNILPAYGSPVSAANSAECALLSTRHPRCWPVPWSWRSPEEKILGTPDDAEFPHLLSLTLGQAAFTLTSVQASLPAQTQDRLCPQPLAMKWHGCLDGTDGLYLEVTGALATDVSFSKLTAPTPAPPGQQRRLSSMWSRLKKAAPLPNYAEPVNKQTVIGSHGCFLLQHNLTHPLIHPWKSIR